MQYIPGGCSKWRKNSGFIVIKGTVNLNAFRTEELIWPKSLFSRPSKYVFKTYIFAAYHKNQNFFAYEAN